jgi:hypothetical protein
MNTVPTSFRLHPDAVNLLRAWAAYLSAQKRRDITRVDVLEQLLADRPPPAGDETPQLADLQAAYQTFLETR